MKSIKTTVVIMLIIAGIQFGQQKEIYSKEPGFFDFKDFAVTKLAEPTTEVLLEEPMLKMLGGMSGEKKGNFGDLMTGLKLVKVNEFDLNQKDTNLIDSNIESMDNALMSKKWERIVKSKHKNNASYIYLKTDEKEGLQGLVIIDYHKGGKFTLVNIVGKMDLASLGKLSTQFNIPQLNKMKEGEKSK